MGANYLSFFHFIIFFFSLLFFFFYSVLSHKAYKVGANLKFLWRLADGWLSATPGQDVNLSLETSSVKLVSTYTWVEWGKWRRNVFSKVKTRSADAGNRTLDPQIQSPTLYWLSQRSPHLPIREQNNETNAKNANTPEYHSRVSWTNRSRVRCSIDWTKEPPSTSFHKRTE